MTAYTARQGPQGETGPPGPTGPASTVPGPAGTPGEKWFTGAGPPSAGTGAVSDWYLDNSSGAYYEKTGSSTWTLRGNLTGPAGPAGPQGSQGVQGVKGDTGNTGPQGPAGADSTVPGPQGPAGPQGAAEGWYSQAGTPGTGLGVVGDWDLDTATGNIYEKTGTTTWTLRANIMGPQGPAGPSGSGTGDMVSTIFDAKGDLLAGTADNTYTRQAVGANGTVLKASSGAATGMLWGTLADSDLLVVPVLSPAADTRNVYLVTANRILLASQITGDTVNRFSLDANGAFKWGPGNAVADVFLQRPGANIIELGTPTIWNLFRIRADVANRLSFQTVIASEAQSRFNIRSEGKFEWTDGTNPVDVSLSRGGVGTLFLGGTSQKGALRVYGGAGTDDVFQAIVTTDAQLRFRVNAAGQMFWGTGTAVKDTSLYRNGVGILALGSPSEKGSLRLYGAVAADSNLEGRIASDAQARWQIAADGTASWGSGSAATDVSLARSAVGELTVTGVLVVTGRVTPASLGSGTRDGTKFLRDDGVWTPLPVAPTVATDTIWDAKGDLAVGTGADTATRVGIGADTQVLTADSSQPSGMKWAAPAGAGAGTSATITQASHGLAVGNLVRLNGSTYQKAQADSAANAEIVGIVSAVADANTFTLTTGGKVTGLSGLTAGTVYFLSAGTAGALTATEPSTIGQVSKPVLVADSTTSGWFFNFRGLVVGGAGAAGGATLTAQMAQLSADVAIGSTNVYVDGPSLSLGPGTWLLTATILFVVSSTGNDVTAKLWDGTNVIASTQSRVTVTQPMGMSLVGIAVVGSTATWKISLAMTVTGTIKAAATVNAAGNNATVLTALKVA